MVISRLLDKAAALSYTTQILAYGRALSGLIGAHYDFARAEARTFVPQDLSGEQMNNLEAGSYLPASIIKTAVSDLIIQLLEERSDYVLIAENACAEPSDPWLLDAEEKTILCKGDVFHFWTLCAGEEAPDRDRLRQEILDTIAVAESAYPPVVCVVAARPASLCLLPDGVFYVLEHEDLVMVAQNAVCILIGAYDGEGFMVWRGTANKPV